ncbi:MAG TPA: cytochrome c oxidase accessory protein CcoG [Vicinamibacterales bacterium]|nr:cytochrome c oxidase accessory protein CcoG [Vicinamibacterales bacterium]
MPLIALSEEHETFRNALASVARDGRRRWIYARQPSGRRYRLRTYVSWVLLAFLALAPFVTVFGQPLMQLDVLHRHFVLLGIVFRPQDFHLVVLIALTLLVTLLLSTVVVGRVWCGWLCPQTVFMEMLFRKIEYAIDGSAERQLRRHRGPWTRERVLRTAVKQAIFAALSFLIANIFLAWIIGAGELWRIVTDPPSQHLRGLTAILIFSAVFYAVFARFREQACVLACPYGRVMSALTDAQTVTVTYDSVRGEPRGRLTHEAAGQAVHGDCIDCHQCVTVCPTGIDIRDGIQLECVNCTACMDACDSVMARLHRPPNLIRWASHAAILAGPAAGARRRWLTARVAAYGAVWLVLAGTVTTLLATRRDLDVVILRQPGTLYTTAAGGDVTNFYQIQALNRTRRDAEFSIDVLRPAGARVTPLGRIGRVGAYELLEGRLLLRVPADRVSGATTPVTFAIRSGGSVVQTIDSSFLGPAAPAGSARR